MYARLCISLCLLVSLFGYCISVPNNNMSKRSGFMEFKIVYGTYIRLFCSHFQAMQFHSLIKINVLSVTYKIRDETKEKPTLIATWKRNWCLKYCLHTAHVCGWVSVNVIKRSNYTGRQKKRTKSILQQWKQWKTLQFSTHRYC